MNNSETESNETLAKAYIVMGVSGCGKTSLGQMLAEQLACAFFDADDFHPAENIEKMAQGQALTDDDREGWLDTLNKKIQEELDQDNSMVLACSALKKKYRAQLKKGHEAFVEVIYLQGTYELIWQRMQLRQGHYMKANMLKSQFDTLEEPTEAITVSIQQELKAMLQIVMKNLN